MARVAMAEVLRKLQGSVFFEKTVKASSASGYHKRDSKLALPFSFVQRHGDKFRKSVLLRTESSTKAWPVTIGICFRSPTCTQLEFSGGWRAFATFHSLLEGDSLIFSLTAMSEFEVYMFPRNENSQKFPSQPAPRKWSNDSRFPRKKAKQSYGCSDEELAADGSIEGAVKLNELIAQKKITTGEQHADSAFGHSPTSLRISSSNKDSKSNVLDYSLGGDQHDSRKPQEPALDHDKLTEPGDSGGRKNASANENQGSTIQKITRTFQLPGFFKKLAVSNFCHGEEGEKLAYYIEIPPGFWKTYGKRLHSVVKLQGIREESPVRTVACQVKHGKYARVFLRAGWGNFATENNLEVGQELLFNLTDDSSFVVREVQPPS